MRKTKVMLSGRHMGVVEKEGKWPCSICRKGVGRNSIQCRICMNWVHKRCSGIRLSLRSATGSFECAMCTRGCDNRDDGDRTCLTLENGETVDCVDKFCYLGDMLNGGGGVESATVFRVRCAWSKFRELSDLLTNKEVSLRLKGKIYTTCVRSAMLYGSETWALKAEEMARLDRTEMRMIRWMSGVKLRERHTNLELREKMGIDSVTEVLRRRRLRWWGHVLRKDDEEWVKKCMDLEVDGTRGRGRPRLRWREVVKKDMDDCGMVVADASDRPRWRMLSWGKPANPCLSREHGR